LISERKLSSAAPNKAGALGNIMHSAATGSPSKVGHAILHGGKTPR
jgi:hypothetical protein